MASEFLTVRLSKDDARVIDQLRENTGLSKSDLVKRALRTLADQGSETMELSLFDLGMDLFGRHGDVRRQSANIKRIAKSRARAKRTG